MRDTNQRANAPRSPIISMRGYVAFIGIAIALTCIAEPVTAAESSIRPDDLSTKQLIAEIVRQVDDKGFAGRYVQFAADRGADAILESVVLLDETKVKRSTALYEVIARAGLGRRVPAELLRLYDPTGHRLYYDKSGHARQTQIAVALDWQEWPYFLPQAVVRAAPIATLAWMQEQAASKLPRTQPLGQLLLEWSRWVDHRHERQHLAELDRVLVTIAANSQAAGDPNVTRSLLRCIGAVAKPHGPHLHHAPVQSDGSNLNDLRHVHVSRKLTDFAIQSLKLKPELRAVACDTLGRLTDRRALLALIDHADREDDSNVLAHVAAAFEGFGDSPQAGQAAMQLFRKSNDARVRRELVLSAAATTWPQRNAILLAALDSQQGGVVAVALQAVTRKSPKTIRDRVVALKDDYDKAPATLVDALGDIAAPSAVPKMIQWLNGERNSAVRLKIALALQKIGTDDAKQAIADWLEILAKNTIAAGSSGVGRKTIRDADLLVYLVRAAGQLQIQAAAPTIMRLIENFNVLSNKVPTKVLVEAIWSLGFLDSPQTRALLNRFSKHRNGGSAVEGSTESQFSELGSLYVELARLKLNEPDAAASVAKLYEFGTPAIRMTALIVLGELGRDHPAIKRAFQSDDFAVLLAAVRSAGKVDARKYRDRLKALSNSQYIKQLLNTGIQDVDTLRHYLDIAIQAAEDDDASTDRGGQ